MATVTKYTVIELRIDADDKEEYYDRLCVSLSVLDRHMKDPSGCGEDIQMVARNQAAGQLLMRSLKEEDFCILTLVKEVIDFASHLERCSKSCSN